nr:glycoside hydrolase family 3 N-terminal domain-containing protein [Pseudomonas sp. FSL R10-2964]
MTQASRFPLAPSDTDLDTRARCLLEGLTLREKIGQKLLVAFRYWCPDDQPACTLSTTRFNSAMGDALRNNAIGGVILFGNNLSSLEQGRTLLDDLRAVPPVAGELGLLLGVDEEEGVSVSPAAQGGHGFPGQHGIGCGLARRW